jgi:hypothetical protein
LKHPDPRNFFPLIQVKATYSSKIFSESNVVLIPVPDNTSKANILVTLGKAKYDATRKALVSALRMWHCHGHWTELIDSFDLVLIFLKITLPRYGRCPNLLVRLSTL